MSTRLRREVAAGRLTPDAAQTAAALRLDALLLAASPPQGVRAGRGAWLERLGALSQRRQSQRVAGPRGLYLWGGVGRGKTLLMDFFADSLADAGVAAERTHFYRFMRDVHSTLAAIKHRAEPLDEVAERLAARTRIICLDEFFVADIADAMILAGLWEGLFRRGVALVTTSNVKPGDLYRDGLQRQRFVPAIDLLERHVDVLHLDGGVDYRLRQLAQAPTYLDSGDSLSPAAMHERFAALSSGVLTGPTTLCIEGRGLRALDSSPGTVWFAFAELCEGPRSQNDYIELARLYHTMFLSDVPVFDGTGENAARRFIMLIDELYDRGVKLVMSAAAAPLVLYRGERLHFEFARAASRLIEMQTQAYLAGEHRP